MTDTSPISFPAQDHACFRVIGLPAFNDNVIWVLHMDGAGAARSEVVVIDPGDAAPVIAYCRQYGLTPTQIWLTHHHADHMGGVAELQGWVGGQGGVLNVYGPAAEAIPGVTQPLHGGETLSLGANVGVSVMAVPGHTRGHLAYFVPGAGKVTPPALFCGDVLFGLGCGRLFEGTAAQMYASLGAIAALPAGTQVYCAHEYTLLNLPFALAVDADNAALQSRAATIRLLRNTGESTLPLTLAEELATNPFLRCDQPALIASAVLPDDAQAVDVFAQLRLMRDTFKAPQ